MALVSVGAYTVHELLYLVGYGREASQALGEQGHGYLGVVGPLVGGVLALTLGWFLAGLVRPGDRGRPGRLRSLRSRWLASSGGLFAVYVVQELLEGALAAGHPAGVAGVLGAGAPSQETTWPSA
jgi:hypothetical protein